MHIQVHINEEGALRNQRHAFTDRFTLISELLQNARRAGATCIEVHYHSAVQILCVSDNGGGIDDFQKLLSFHESG
jgi:signal transduction histidine kinase